LNILKINDGLKLIFIGLEIFRDFKFVDLFKFKIKLNRLISMGIGVKIIFLNKNPGLNIVLPPVPTFMGVSVPSIVVPPPPVYVSNPVYVSPSQPHYPNTPPKQTPPLPSKSSPEAWP
jgi:hypothetical protein